MSRQDRGLIMKVLITAKRAIFSRPELKVERFSYEVPTPSAIKGVLESIYWKPEMKYCIEKITVLNEIKFQEVMTVGQAESINSISSITRDQNCTLKSMSILTDVAYAIDFHIELTGKGTHDNDVVKKHTAIFYQRLQKGQQYRTPYLGCKEFVCDIVDGKEISIPESFYKGSVKHLGIMLHHIQYGVSKNKQVWYRPVMRDGVIDCNLSSSNHEGWVFEKLVNYYDQNKEYYNLPDPGFSIEKVHYVLEIDTGGNPVSFMPIKITEKGKLTPVMLQVPESVLGRGLSIRANFAWDNEKYVLGIDKKDTDGKSKQKAFREKIELVTEGIEDPELKAVKMFCKEKYQNAIPFVERYLDKNGKFGGNIVFCVNGSDHYFHENPVIRDAWMQYYEKKEKAEPTKCLVTGDLDIPVRIHPFIKGVNGSPPFAKLISLNYTLSGAQSYGWEGLENSPIGKVATFKYSTALNYLLSQLDHRISMGDSTFVFWSDTDHSEILKFVKYMLSGYCAEDIETNTIPEGERFYILELKANSSRLYIRKYDTFTWGEDDSIQHLMQYIFDNHEINKKSFWNVVDLMSKDEVSKMEKTQGYHLGELLALCEKAQRDAVTSVRGTRSLADTYMRAASSMPEKVFPIILNKTQYYLNKVNYGVRSKIQDLMEILSEYDEPFPSKLDNKEQCYFIAGYNLKCKELYSKIDKNEKKEA